MSCKSRWYFEQLRIADFYLLFFFRLEHARLARKHRAIKTLARSSAGHRYERQPSDKLIFDRMANIQKAAADTLVAGGYFDVEEHAKGVLVATQQAIPDSLAARIDVVNMLEASHIEAIQSLVSDYEFLGPNGLKARTGLLEYRYDAA